MLKEILRIKWIVLFCIVILLILYVTNIEMFSGRTKVSKLVIYGDNITTKYDPFVESDGIYLSVDTISKTLDENIFYDTISNKVIITTYNDVVKFKIDESKISKNLEYSDLTTPAKVISKEPFIPINVLQDVYGITVTYNKDTKTISIDKKDVDTAKVEYNKTRVYSDLNTDSEVIETLNQNDSVIAYTKSLSHNRWLKIKTENGIVGYVAKTSVAISENENVPEENLPTENKEKITMFWQYGSDLNTMEKSKIEGVDIVSPTWYELKNSKGEISSKYNSAYYNQAKGNGYKIWPIITNGIDSASYSPADTAQLLNSEYNREQFIKNIIKIMNDDKLDGINIDFESMKTEDRDMYTQFIRELAPMVRRQSKTLSVDTYFVAYIDREKVGAATDYLILMGYDQRGNWSSESGSIAEISWVESNIESLIEDSKIPAEKIILGVPFYTRLWTEKAGEDPTSKIYTMEQCEEYINSNHLTPVWDEDAGQNYVELTQGSLKYKLWLEDTQSIKKRVESVNKYNLAGISAWRKGLETDGTWKVIEDNLAK